MLAHTVFVIDAENKPPNAGAFDSMDIAKLLEPAKAMELTSQPNPAKPGERILKDGFLFCVFGDDKFVDNSFKDMRQRKMNVVCPNRGSSCAARTQDRVIGTFVPTVVPPL